MIADSDRDRGRAVEVILAAAASSVVAELLREFDAAFVPRALAAEGVLGTHRRLAGGIVAAGFRMGFETALGGDGSGAGQ